MTKNQIILISGKQCWEAQFIGPHAAKVQRLFGTTILPTPFVSDLRISADPDYIKAAIERMNPGVFVSFA